MRFLLALIALVLGPTSANVSVVAEPLSQDDAGSGRDAGSSFDTAVLLSPGKNHAELAWRSDTHDMYKFVPAQGDIIRLSISPPEGLTTYLFDPAGRYRDVGELPWEVENVTSIALPPGEWHLSVQSQEGILEPPHASFGYTVELAYERHEHVFSAEVHGESAAAVVANLSLPGFSRLEVYSYFTQTFDAWADIDAFVYRQGPHCFQNVEDWWGNAPVGTESTLHAEGQHIRVERISVANETWLVRFREETWDPYSVAWGIGSSEGVQFLVYAVWDGDGFNVSLPAGAEATFVRASAFDGSGTTASVAGVGAAAGTKHVDIVPAGPGVQNLVSVDTSGPSKTRVLVELPDGTSRIVEGEYASWFGRLGGRGSLLPPAGQWNATIQQLAGTSVDDVIYKRLTVPFETAC